MNEVLMSNGRSRRKNEKQEIKSQNVSSDIILKFKNIVNFY